MTINELREVFNLAPTEDGDVRMQSLNFVSSEIADDYQLNKDDNEQEENNTNEEGGNEDEGEGN